MIQTPSTYFKRGSTFSLAGYATLPAGVWTATSEIKDNAGVVVAELNVTLESPPLGTTRWPILLSYPNSTSDWPLGSLSCDIRFVSGGNIIYTPTFVIMVVKEITTPIAPLVIGGLNV